MTTEKNAAGQTSSTRGFLNGFNIEKFFRGPPREGPWNGADVGSRADRAGIFVSSQ
jgi:hypothetical protein